MESSLKELVDYRLARASFFMWREELRQKNSLKAQSILFSKWKIT